MKYIKIKRDSEVIEIDGINFRVPLEYNMISEVSNERNGRRINMAIFDGDSIMTKSFGELVSPHIQDLVDTGLDLYNMCVIDEANPKWKQFSKFKLSLIIKGKGVTLTIMRGSDESYSPSKLYWNLYESNITEEDWDVWQPMIIDFAKKIVATTMKH